MLLKEVYYGSAARFQRNPRAGPEYLCVWPKELLLAATAKWSQSSLTGVNKPANGALGSQLEWVMEQVCAEASNELFTVIQLFMGKRELRKYQKTKQMVGQKCWISKKRKTTSHLMIRYDLTLILLLHSSSPEHFINWRTGCRLQPTISVSEVLWDGSLSNSE